MVSEPSYAIDEAALKDIVVFEPSIYDNGGRLERIYHGPPRRRRAAPRVAGPLPGGVPEPLRPRRPSAAGGRVERAAAREFVSSGVGVPIVNGNIPLQASLG